MGRLSWLDSTLGIDETVTDGFAPVEITQKDDAGMSVKVGGCNKVVDVSSEGMVQQITVENNKTRNGQRRTTQTPTLASPVEFVLFDLGGKPVPLTVVSPLAVTKHTAATAQWTTQLSGGGVTVEVNGVSDLDVCPLFMVISSMV